MRGSAAPSVTVAEFVEPDLAPARQRDRQRREIVELARAGERADRLLLARDLAASAAEIDVVGAHLLVDGRRGDAERQQLLRIERDADFAIDAAEALDLADAADALQIARDRIVDEPGQLLDRKPGRRGRVGDDRQALDIDAADDRLVDGARQIGANLGDLILHVVERAVDVDRADGELDDGRGRSVGDGRNDVPDAVDARNRVLDLLRHLRFEFRRRRARLGDQHLHDRNVDVGKAGDRHRPEADEAENRSRPRTPPTAGIGRRIDQAETLRRMGNRLLAAGRGASGIGRTRSPGRKNAAARATTLSPAATPLSISTVSPSTMPGVTRRSSTLSVAHDIEARRIALALQRRRRGADAVAPRELDLARGEGADMGVRHVGERDAHLAGAARLVDFLVDEAELAADRALDARQLQFRRHADGEPGQRLLRHVGLEIDRAVLDDAEKRLARARWRRRRAWPSAG